MVELEASPSGPLFAPSISTAVAPVLAASVASSAYRAPDFVLLGPSGFLGAAILRALEGGGHRVASSRVRLQDRLGIEQLLDEQRPSLGVICAAGERGRPNILWCDSHPVETVDANITGQLSVAAACHARGLHVTLLGTGALYSADPTALGHRFKEEEPPNAKQNVYLALRRKMEEILAYFDNALILRVLYPVSSDLDPRGLIGKLARFERVDKVHTSVTVCDDLFPLLPELVRSRTTGVLNFTSRGTVSYADIVEQLAQRAPEGWRRPHVDVSAAARPACELDVEHLASACSCEVPYASAAVRRIIAGLSHEDLKALVQSSTF